jgi:cysteine-S-conjugate beta-lyase
MEEKKLDLPSLCKSRKGTGSLKYDGMEPLFGRDDLEPFWVADMDFCTPTFIVEAAQKRISNNVFGYPVVEDGFFDAVSLWFSKRFGVEIQNEWIVPMTGVAASMFTALLAFSEEGDGVVVQPPVYGPFFGVTRAARRELIENPLVLGKDGYEIDFGGLEVIFKNQKPKILLFCSPHNPVGRVWRQDELSRLVALCLAYDVLIVSDEIHFDLVFAPSVHTTLLAYEEVRKNLVVLSAPTKTFNIPGLNVSYAVIPNRTNKKRFELISKNLHQSLPNIFGLEAIVAAYKDGDAWLEEAKNYLAQNKKLIDEFVLQNEFVSGYSPEGTYLYWLDFSATRLSSSEISDRLKDAGVALSGGDFFFGGKESLFFRFNFAADRDKVVWALECIVKVFS